MVFYKKLFWMQQKLLNQSGDLLKSVVESPLIVFRLSFPLIDRPA